MTASPKGLALPHNVIAKLTPAPFLHAHLSSTPPIRPNGRAPTEFRPPSVNTSSLTHCAGSAVVRTGDTAVVCGVRAEILNVDDIPDASFLDAPPSSPTTPSADAILATLNLLVPNVELSTGCSPLHLPGTAPSPLAQSLSHRIHRLLLSTHLIALDDLRITYTPPPSTEPDRISDALEDTASDTALAPCTKAFWTLHISLLVLALSGPPLPALWAALLAALRDVRLPRAWWDADRGLILCSERADEARALVLRGLPVASAWGVFGAGVGGQVESQSQGQVDGDRDSDSDGRTGSKGRSTWVLADPDAFEEGLCCGSVEIVVDCSGDEMRILEVEAAGRGVTGAMAGGELMAQAEERWKVWEAVLREAEK